MSKRILCSLIILAALTSCGEKPEGGKTPDGGGGAKTAWSLPTPLVQKVEVRSDGTLIETYEYTYDEKGRVSSLLKTDQIQKAVLLHLVLAHHVSEKNRKHGAKDKCHRQQRRDETRRERERAAASAFALLFQEVLECGENGKGFAGHREGERGGVRAGSEGLSGVAPIGAAGRNRSLSGGVVDGNVVHVGEGNGRVEGKGRWRGSRAGVGGQPEKVSENKLPAPCSNSSMRDLSMCSTACHWVRASPN